MQVVQNIASIFFCMGDRRSLPDHVVIRSLPSCPGFWSSGWWLVILHIMAEHRVRGQKDRLRTSKFRRHVESVASAYTASNAAKLPWISEKRQWLSCHSHFPGLRMVEGSMDNYASRNAKTTSRWAGCSFNSAMYIVWVDLRWMLIT